MKAIKALKVFPERDFEFFRNGITSGRLNPVRMGKAQWVFPFLSLVGAYGSTELTVIKELKDTWYPFLVFQRVSLIILGGLSLLFFFRKICLKFQRFQMLVLVFSALKAPFDLTFMAFVVLKTDDAFFFIWNIYLHISIREYIRFWGLFIPGIPSAGKRRVQKKR
ncbi:hypothetical protein QS257_02505 [Terrilactibacillus sp. S3-3]|nr:hypothetical protein QS257_02505 [Terrilactibacillus sp. S3-3]